MLRRALLIATSLLLGLATSIAIAWHVAMSPRRQITAPSIVWPTANPRKYMMDTANQAFAWTGHTYELVGALVVTDRDIQILVPTFVDDHGTVSISKAPIPAEVTEYPNSTLILTSAAGFPFHCLQSTQWYQNNPARWTPIADRGVLYINTLSSAPLPSAPIWRGLIADTAIYAILCWLALSSVTATRRYLRRRRNLCLTCAYDRRGLAEIAPCPECGHT